MKLLLHTCCAPCSGAIIETLLKEGVSPTVYYCNPNIYPYEEYLKRKDECSRYSQANGLQTVDADYNHGDWLGAVCGLENEPERGARCTECFRFRLLNAARYAAANGYDSLATTLASSRWKNLDQVNAAGEWAVAKVAEETGTTVQWYGRNWRKGGLQERRGQIIKEQNFYNQLYCGCEFSMSKDK